MKLEIAERIAAGLIAKLAPFCERSGDFTSPQAGGVNPPLPALAVAGSIRRRRPVVNDIDLVAIPKLARVPIGAAREKPAGYFLMLTAEDAAEGNAPFLRQILDGLETLRRVNGSDYVARFLRGQLDLFEGPSPQRSQGSQRTTEAA